MSSSFQGSVSKYSAHLFIVSNREKPTQFKLVLLFIEGMHMEFYIDSIWACLILFRCGFFYVLIVIIHSLSWKCQFQQINVRVR